VHRPTGVISVAVDRVDGADRAERWVRVKSGRVNDDVRDTRIILYMEAYRAAHGVEPNVAIHYTRTGEVKHARPGRDTVVRHLEKIDAQLAGIMAGHWDPNRGHHCAECPFVLICAV
jgi:CRISPR/Cas system-associated exonuclease Cas4 (RecB family)